MANLLDIKCDIDVLLQDIRSYVDEFKELSYSSGDICPRCKSLNKSKVYDTRINHKGYRIRNKQCTECNHKWKTVEIIYSENIREYSKGDC